MGFLVGAPGEATSRKRSCRCKQRGELFSPRMKNTIKAVPLKETAFMVCPPGLEPGPKASEAFMVSNSTTGTRRRKNVSFFGKQNY